MKGTIDLGTFVLQLLGKKDLRNIIRMQFARMQPGIHIRTHRDHGKWAMHAHRLHVPITAAPGVDFMVLPLVDSRTLSYTAI